MKFSVRCGICLYWVEDVEGQGTGSCHRFPPTVINRESGKHPLMSWPMIHAENFCGEFVEIDEEMLDE